MILLDLNILIIDDDIDVLKSLMFNMKNSYNGIKITVANSGKDGLKYIKNNGFNLVLLDLVMPEMDGIEVLKQINKLEKKYPVIIMTAYAQTTVIEDLKKIEHEGFLKKPFDINELTPFFNKIKKTDGNEE